MKKEFDADEAEKANDYQLDRQIGFQLRRAHQHASSVFQSIMSEHKLTPGQFAVLARVKEAGELTQNQLGRSVDMDTATVYGVVVRLEKRGLLERFADEKHRSRLRVRLSAEGQALVQTCFVPAQQVSELTLQSLSAEEGRQLLELLSKLVNKT